jgi:prevent-host-death family protein
MPDTNLHVTSIAESEAITRLPELLDRVQRGEVIVILRDGKPAARLTPTPAPTHDVAKAIAAVDRLMALRERIAREQPPFSIAEILELRDAGRRF